MVFNELENVLRFGRSNICQAPNGLKLKLWRLVVLAKLEQSGDEVAVDSLVDGWVLLEGEELAESDSREDLDDWDI